MAVHVFFHYALTCNGCGACKEAIAADGHTKATFTQKACHPGWRIGATNRGPSCR